MLFGGWTFIILVPGILLALWAQAKVTGAFNRYSRVRASCGMTGAQVAHELLRRAGALGAIQESGPAAAQAARLLGAVQVRLGEGSLTDHYDPSKQVLALSPQVYQSNSLAALGVAAHETGHALQHATRYGALSLRTAMVPAVSLGSKLWLPLFLVGLIFSWGPLLDVGILLYAAAVAFTLVTLPVEFNASRRAVALLQAGGYIRAEEVKPTKAVLDAAALTYVAAAVMAILTLLRLLILRGQRD